MRHTAKRLIPYAVNGVVHVRNVTDPALKRLVKKKELAPLIRRGLKEYGQHYELYIPYQVDSEEMQFKRRLQLKFGTTVNLSDLKANHRTYYKKLCEYGTPADVLRGWGLGVTYNHTMSEEELHIVLEEINEGGVIKSIGRNSRLYNALSYQARKRGTTVSDYLASLGYTYKGGGSVDRSNEGDV